jgi:hypothetical protein
MDKVELIILNPDVACCTSHYLNIYGAYRRLGVQHPAKSLFYDVAPNFHTTICNSDIYTWRNMQHLKNYQT